MLVSLDICSNFFMIDLGVMTESIASKRLDVLSELPMFSNLEQAFLTEPADNDSGSGLSILGTFGHIALLDCFLFRMRCATFKISLLLRADVETGVSASLRFDGLGPGCLATFSLFVALLLYCGDDFIIGAGDLLKFLGE